MSSVFLFCLCLENFLFFPELPVIKWISKDIVADEQVDPLENLEKILDCQMRPLRSPGSHEDVAVASSSRLIKRYLVKWKGRSYLHCSW